MEILICWIIRCCPKPIRGSLQKHILTTWFPTVQKGLSSEIYLAPKISDKALWTIHFLTSKYIYKISGGSFILNILSRIWVVRCFHNTLYKIITLTITYMKVKVKVTQSCLTLWDPMDYTVHGILQARMLECVAIPFSRQSSQPRDRTQVSHVAGRFFISWATREAHDIYNSSWSSVIRTKLTTLAESNLLSG